MVAGSLKSKRAYRTVGMPASLAGGAGRPSGGFPFVESRLLSCPRADLYYNRFRRRFWNPTVEASVGAPSTPHDLRHTHVAMLIAEGQSPRYIADRLGHESTRTVLDVYGHLYEGLDEAAMEGLERLRAEAETDIKRTRGPSEGRELFPRLPESQVP